MSTRIRGICGLQTAGAVLTSIVWLFAGQIRAADSSTVTPSIRDTLRRLPRQSRQQSRSLPRGTGRERGRRMGLFRGGNMLRGSRQGTAQVEGQASGSASASGGGAASASGSVSSSAAAGTPHDAEYGSLPEQGSAAVSVTEGVDASGQSQKRVHTTGRLPPNHHGVRGRTDHHHHRKTAAVIVTVINHEVEPPGVKHYAARRCRRARPEAPRSERALSQARPAGWTRNPAAARPVRRDLRGNARQLLRQQLEELRAKADSPQMRQTIEMPWRTWIRRHPERPWASLVNGVGILFRPGSPNVSTSYIRRIARRRARRRAGKESRPHFAASGPCRILRKFKCHMGHRIVMATMGSYGDVNPYLGLSLALKSPGHQPVIATGAFYRETIERAGIEFQPVRPDADPTDRAMLWRGLWIPNWAPSTFCATWCCAFPRFV